MPSSRPLHPDLSPLVEACEADLRTCAQVWHQRGAQRFGLYAEEKPLFESGGEKVKKTAVMRQSPVLLDGKARAFVRVHGPAKKLMQSHLDANAALFGRIFQLEHDNRVKTMYLAEVQKRLTNLHKFVHASRLMHQTISDIISDMSRTTLDVLAVSGTFLYVNLMRPISASNHFAHFSDTQGEIYLQQVQVANCPQRSQFMPPRDSGEELLLVPIYVLGVIKGVMGFIDPPTRFTPFYEKMAEIVAEQIGARIEHVLLYDNILYEQRLTTEMELARQVQMHLLPQKQPTIPGLDICGMTFPALQVGGDFYEFLINDQTFTFIVGDVSGKGLSAAMMMAMTRAILRSTASFAFAVMTPEDVLTQTNEDVYEDYNRVTTFTTTFMGQYDLAPIRDRLVIANAGHSPVLYCPLGEPSRLLEADAPPLGVLETIGVANHTIGFKPGDLLIVATDGFSEAENSADEIFGYDRLLELADQTRHLSAREIVKAFSEVATAFEGDRPQHDDRTIVVIKRLNPPDEDSSNVTP